MEEQQSLIYSLASQLSCEEQERLIEIIRQQLKDDDIIEQYNTFEGRCK